MNNSFSRIFSFICNARNNNLDIFQVLFEELKLDKKCAKKLARTTIMNQRSTSEAVVSFFLFDQHCDGSEI